MDVHRAQVTKHINKWKLIADVTRSPKQGYQWPHKKANCLQKLRKIGCYLEEYKERIKERLWSTLPRVVITLEASFYESDRQNLEKL